MAVAVAVSAAGVVDTAADMVVAVAAGVDAAEIVAVVEIVAIAATAGKRLSLF